MSETPFDFRIIVSGPNAHEEADIVNRLASEFIRLGVKSVMVVANGEHVNYVDGEVHNLTNDDDLVYDRTAHKPAAHVMAHNPSTSLN